MLYEVITQEEFIEEIDTEPEIFAAHDSEYESREEPEEIVFGGSSISSSEPTEDNVISGSPSVAERDEPSVLSSPEPMEEREDTFSSPSSTASEEPVSSHTADEDIIGRSKPKSIWSPSASTPASTPVTASVPPTSEAPKRQTSGYEAPSDSIA